MGSHSKTVDISVMGGLTVDSAAGGIWLQFIGPDFLQFFQEMGARVG
jgi:hypothetical protein